MSPMVDGRIQAFPWASWREELALARRHGFPLMEWTLDQERLYENPLLTAQGQSEIRTLTAQHGVRIPSLTGDCFMQAPFWKAADDERVRLTEDFLAIAEACATVGISLLVVPLVDNGRLETDAQETALWKFLSDRGSTWTRLGLRILFESDYVPHRLGRLIERFEPGTFGINYDIGNSAALGFDPVDEMSAYGGRIGNVHVKDRALGGTTVPLGLGAADFPAAFAALKRSGYEDNFILQAARASDGDDVGALCRYRDLTVAWAHVAA